MKDRIANILDRHRNWSEERKADSAELLKLIEDHDSYPHRLTAEQAAEVRCRLAKTSSKPLTLTVLDERFEVAQDIKSYPPVGAADAGPSYAPNNAASV
jgi:hypothetical protein